MKLDIKAFIKYLEEFVQKNPDVVVKMGLSVPLVKRLLSKGVLATIVKETYKGVMGGATVGQAFSDAISSSAATGAIAKGVKTGLIVAASAFAFGTIKEAVKSGVATVQGNDTGWDKIWKFAWNTSIPGATVNQFRSFAHWLSTTPEERANGKTKPAWVTDPKPKPNPQPELTDRKQISKSDLAGIINGTKVISYDGKEIKDKTDVTRKPTTEENLEAVKLGMGARPVGSGTAQYYYDKEVERRMKQNKPNGSTGNAPKWYFQGLASRMLGTTLTWSGVKSIASGHRFVGAAALHVNLTFPTDQQKLLHPQVISNNNIEWQALRGKNTGAFNYGEEEVFKYDWTLMALIAVYRFTGKLISLSNNHDVEVDHLPQLLYAGFNNSVITNANTGETVYADVITNKPNYVTRLNAIGKDINTYALKDRTLISRWNYIADKCVKDYSGKKAVYGYYALRFVPGMKADGTLIYYNLENFTITQLLQHMETQLNYIRTCASGSWPAGVFLKVAGDMIKLLGANKETFTNVPYFTGTEVYKFEYDPEAFDQIRNAKMVLWGVQDAPNYARTAPHKIECHLDTTSGAAATTGNGCYLLADNYLMTSERKVEFSHEENLQMIQFVCNCKVRSSKTTGVNVEVIDCGTTLLDHVSVATYTSAGQPEIDNYCGIVTEWNGVDTKQVMLHGLVPTLHGTAADKYTRWLSDIAQIDFMPRMQFYYITANEATAASLVLDVDNYAFMTDLQYTQLNNVAVYSQTFVFMPEDVKITGILS